MDPDMMNPKASEPRAAGIFLALGAIGGSSAGIFFGQPSIGLLAGLGTGSAIAFCHWFVDRNRA